MIEDLSVYGESNSVDADVCVIGGGIAGLLLATRVAEQGLRVVVLESGGLHQDHATHPLNAVIQRGDDYRGALHGRARCLGGTSTLWGGALLPFLPSDFAAREHVGLAAWPVAYDKVMRYLPQIERLFGLCSGTYDEDFVRMSGSSRHVPIEDADFIARFAKWPPFSRRNVFRLMQSQVESGKRLTAFINATATEFAVDSETGRLRTVTARHAGGQSITVRASHFAICAGAIESSRLLLLLDFQHQNKFFAPHGVLGRYFHDHVSVAAADIKARSIARLNRLAGFRFAGTTMRSLRYELSPAVQRAEKVGSAFGHIAFQSTRPSGFDALRELLRNSQRGRRATFRSIANLLADSPYLARAAYWRYVRHQLLWPPAEYSVHSVIEQLPFAENRITLSEKRDVFGLPLAEIDWRVRASEHLTHEAFRRRFDAFWRRKNLHEVGDLVWRSDASQSGADIFHPGGTTRMGADARSGVVDANLRTFAVPNLSVASTSVFPSGSSANPTLMLMLFVERLAASLLREARSTHSAWATPRRFG